ncbi:MAG: hypothetical protein LBS53_03000 [Synergistaceae bacterium]|nr:hypothetical protein [Synergistaceae bacterium]
MSQNTNFSSTNKSVDFSKLVHANADDLKCVAAKHGPLGIAIVNTARNGVRMSFTKALHEALGNPAAIQFATGGDYLYVGKTIPHSTESVPFSYGKGVNTIYARGFIIYLTNFFSLDFSNRTSISFTDVEIMEQEYEGEQIIFAKIKMINTGTKENKEN